MPKGKPGWNHGISTTGYKKYGCRCVKCCTANTIACRKYNQVHYVPHPKTHVHGSYNNATCKHPLCVARSTAYKLEWSRSEKGKATMAAWYDANQVRVRKQQIEYGKVYRKTIARKNTLARYQRSAKRKAALERYRSKATAQQYKSKHRITRADKLKFLKATK